jgi:hypothetical protein
MDVEHWLQNLKERDNGGVVGIDVRTVLNNMNNIQMAVDCVGHKVLI